MTCGMHFVLWDFDTNLQECHIQRSICEDSGVKELSLKNSAVLQLSLSLSLEKKYS